MNMMMMMSTISICLSMLIMLIATILSKKMILDQEKMTPFECGFDPFHVARIPFSLKFFLIGVIFLIFDVEIAIILPTMQTMMNSSLTMWTVTFTFFILILLLGLYYEWYQGALDWTN
uniref:NADH-ubiquinone oxidoreductase chain 3 n=1 Tax=Megaloprepus caerulatus TaxID=263994 RepID=A0A342ZZN3_9ODON|nr:NADH dehydrogenase subunit 3 [Megaloprepus caerulatus]AOW43834.1 NADH dehydrogenase subunit 3 [Megaloprepus caerulatus]